MTVDDADEQTETPSRVNQWIPNDDYWFEQRYEAAFLVEHGHQLGIPCDPEICRRTR